MLFYRGKPLKLLHEAFQYVERLLYRLGRGHVYARDLERVERVTSSHLLSGSSCNPRLLVAHR